MCLGFLLSLLDIFFNIAGTCVRLDEVGILGMHHWS